MTTGRTKSKSGGRVFLCAGMKGIITAGQARTANLWFDGSMHPPPTAAFRGKPLGMNLLFLIRSIMSAYAMHTRPRFSLISSIILAVFFFPGFLDAQRIDPASIQVGAAPAWNQELGDVVLGQPYLQAESAIVACAGGAIKSFYMSGTALWSFDPNAAVTPFIARSVEGAAYICDSSGVFKAINRVGRELWRLNLGQPITYPPVVGWDGRVFIFAGSRLICRTAAGHALWSFDLGSPVVAPPKLDHAGSVAAVLQNRDFVRVSQFGAVERMRLDQQPLLVVSLKSGRQDAYVLLYPSGQTEKINFDETAAKGSRLSRNAFPALPSAPASAASMDDHFTVTLRDGGVLLMDASGRALWRGDSHETAAEKGPANIDHTRAVMVFDERGIYSITTRGATGFAIDGRRRLILKIEEASSVPGFSDEGFLYVCGKDKTLHTYKLDSKPRTIPRSRYYGPEPEGSYGMGNPPPSPWAAHEERFQEYNQNDMYVSIERAINSGQLGENEPAYVGYLMEMIGFFLTDPHYSRVRPQVKPIQQVNLIRLLGQVGSRETIPFLWNIFDKCVEPSVKSACAEAIGSIGVDPNGSTFESYNFLLAANNPNRDPQLLMSATSSIAALCRFSGPPLSGDGILLLRYFSNLSWAPYNVKSQIRQEIDGLYREGLDKVMR